MFIGFGTVVNVFAIIAGAGIGMLLGERLPVRTRETVTDVLGLVTMLMGALSVVEVTNPTLSGYVGGQAPVLIVLGSLLIGGIAGSLFDLEARLEQLARWLRRVLVQRNGEVTPDNVPDADAMSPRERFVEGFVSSSLLFLIGPMAILGSLSEGLGQGPDTLVVKATLDGFAAIAFASGLGVGVMFASLGVALYQGLLTLIGFLFGGVLAEPHVLGLTATGGLMLVALGIRLLEIKPIPLGNLLPALIVAPVLVEVVHRFA
ncbi:DUF554 domain-containing protein [Granulicoccus phenolivorans]|uniref:DUF554 domain-containing protein n=1 Tax=Granulicoccus phenolivorans TaxID=266854 RepID=UPI0003F5D616|nr:DUF554 domain-containing protein [Granulicoccus phenolivorans]